MMVGEGREVQFVGVVQKIIGLDNIGERAPE